MSGRTCDEMTVNIIIGRRQPLTSADDFIGRLDRTKKYIRFAKGNAGHEAG